MRAARAWRRRSLAGRALAAPVIAARVTNRRPYDGRVLDSSVQAWLARADCRIKLHFVPAYCPHLNAIERLWGLMHRHITYNKCYSTFREFSTAMLSFLREEVPKNWNQYCDQVTDNFRIIIPTEFRIIGCTGYSEMRRSAARLGADPSIPSI